MQNQTVNGYTLHHQLGAGGMAEVWFAENRIGKKAAVKIIRKELSLLPEIVTRFENEARVMVTLNHPHIRQVYDYAMIDGRPCIIMEYLEGADLSARLKSGERFSQSDMETWWNQLVEALNYTHAQNIVHRDIKPSNLFLTTDGQIKLLDFGIAKVKGGLTHTQTGTRMGTLLYMSPEQVKDSKHLDHRTDVYSLAVTFFHLVTGMAPYDNTKSSEFEIQTKIVTEPLDLNQVSMAWKNLLEPLLQKEIGNRNELQKFSYNNAERHYETKHAETNNTIIEKLPEEKRAFKTSHFSSFKETVEGVVFEMVAVDNGSFLMGSNEGESDEQPLHRVTISDFYIGKTPVTQALWKAVMSRNLLSFNLFSANNPSYFKDDALPVENVSWLDIQSFIQRLNSLTAKEYRLPTEAEWEYAAGGGAADLFAGVVNGSSSTSDRTKWAGTSVEHDLRRFMWFNENSGSRTHRVASKEPNSLDLFDMSGNVWEWCCDWYGPYPANDVLNPTGKKAGKQRVARGGSWGSSFRKCSVSARGSGSPTSRSNFVGFRLALSL